MTDHFFELTKIFDLKPDLEPNSKPFSKKIPTSQKSMKSITRDLVSQFFGNSRHPSLFGGYSHTDFTILRRMCRSFIELSNKNGQDFSLICHTYFLEGFANHHYLASSINEMYHSFSNKIHDKSNKAILEKILFNTDLKDSIEPIKEHYLNQMVLEMAKLRISETKARENGNFLEVSPAVCFPTFSRLNIMDPKERKLALNFLNVLMKYLNENQMFIHQLRIKKLVEYNQMVLKYQNKLSGLSQEIRSDSVYCFSVGDTEGMLDEDFKIEDDVQIKKKNRKSTQSAQNLSRSRFISSTSPTTFKDRSSRNIPHQIKENPPQVEEKQKEESTTATCSICQRKVSGLIWICTKCTHGGHLHHMNRWFGQNSKCPTCFDCNCKS